MVKVIIFEKPGEASVLRETDIKLPEPKADELLIKHTAIEVNYEDILNRNGTTKFAGNILGYSAVGIVEAVGKDVKGIEVGSKVAFATKKNGGAYAEKSVVKASICVHVPDNVPDKTLAACFYKGMVAHMLTHRCYIARPNHVILIHAVDTPFGQIMCQWANSLGSIIIGSVADDDNAELAKKAGCGFVVNYNSSEWKDEILKVTSNYGVHCVYDPFGQATFQDSIDCITPMGIMVSYGSLQSEIKEISKDVLARKSLFLTFPNVFTYKENRSELIISADELFLNLTEKIIKPTIAAELPLSKAQEAHEMIENDNTVGSVILIP